MNRKKEKKKQELKIRILATPSHLELALNPFELCTQLITNREPRAASSEFKFKLN